MRLYNSAGISPGLADMGSSQDENLAEANEMEDPVISYVNQLLAGADRGEFKVVDVWPDTLTSILVVVSESPSQCSTIEQLCPAPPGFTVVSVREFVQTGYRSEGASFMSGLLFEARDRALALGQPLAIRLYDGQSWAILNPSGQGGLQDCHITFHARPGELEQIANLAELAFPHFQAVRTALSPSSWLMVRTKVGS